ncbi:MAG TPA: dihydrofolate reductase family protein [Candidatus Limnocylindrales bacterium]|nr:dihydrofolate reductase family protein [Candidatus Limnocylindrales bacterium]
MPSDEELIAAYAPEDRSVPMIRLNMVSSLDGAATLEGRAGGLGGPADQAMMNRLRMLADVILVGAGTVRVEGYQGDLIDDKAVHWRLEHGLPPHPQFVVITRKGGGPPLSELVAKFREQRAQVLCEGGPHIFGQLAAVDAIDDLCLTIGPLLAGPEGMRITAGAPHPPRRMTFVHAIPIEGLLFLRYKRPASSVTHKQ